MNFSYNVKINEGLLYLTSIYFYLLIVLFSTTLKSFPSGEIINLAILKYCIPNGIPMIVIHKIIPVKHNPMAIQIPPKIAHITFMNFLNPVRFLLTTDLPKGQITNFDNLNSYIPVGINIIVQQ